MKRQYFFALGVSLGLGLLLLLLTSGAFEERRPPTRDQSAAKPTKTATHRPKSLNHAPQTRLDLPPRANQQETEFITAVYEIARTQPVEAVIRAMDNAPATPAGDDLITREKAAAQWAVHDPRASSAWAKKITDEELRVRVLSAVAAVWGDNDPVAAAELALQSLPPGRQQNDAIVSIVQRWVQKQPQAAATWVLEFPKGSLKEIALENVVKIWAQQNPSQTTQWLNTLPPGESRDLAIAVYATEIAPSSPTLATQWAASIGDTGLRDQQLAALAAHSPRSLN